MKLAAFASIVFLLITGLAGHDANATSLNSQSQWYVSWTTAINENTGGTTPIIAVEASGRTYIHNLQTETFTVLNADGSENTAARDLIVPQGLTGRIRAIAFNNAQDVNTNRSILLATGHELEYCHARLQQDQSFSVCENSIFVDLGTDRSIQGGAFNSSSDKLYVTHGPSSGSGAWRISVFDRSLTLIDEVEASDVLPQAIFTRIKTNSADEVFVFDPSTCASSASTGQIRVFDSNWGLLREYVLSNCSHQNFALFSDGLLIPRNGFDPLGWRLVAQTTALSGKLDGIIYALANQHSRFDYAVVNDQSFLVATSSDASGRFKVIKYSRSYGIPDVPVAAIPVPVVNSVTQSPGSTNVVIDFSVMDADSVDVNAALVAFSGGERSLSSLFPISSLSPVIGNSEPTNTSIQTVWSAEADLPGDMDFLDVSIAVLAQDSGRGLIGLHQLVIPQSVCPDTVAGGDLVITATPVDDMRLLDAWFWLVAKNDPGITFSNGEIRDAGTAALLASGTTTTEDGRTFLYARVGMREALPGEIECAREATTPGLVNQFVPEVRFGDKPATVNELGFDTGTYTDARFLVMQSP